VEDVAGEQRGGRLEHEAEEDEDSRVSRDDRQNRAFGSRPRRVGWRILRRHMGVASIRLYLTEHRCYDE
jgi:hypothetical protein